MIENVHSLSSRIRHSRAMASQHWFCDFVEPPWQKVFIHNSGSVGN